MSNHDLLDWCRYLKIPINNVLSRDEKDKHKHKLAIFSNSGSHWVATYVKIK